MRFWIAWSRRSSNPCPASPRQVSRSIFWSAGDGMAWAKHTSFKEPKQSFRITTAILHLRCADRFGAQSAHTSAFFHFQRLRSDVRIVSKRAKARNFQKQRANMSEPTTQAPKQLTSKRAKLFWVGTIPMQNGKEDHWEVKRWKSKFGEIVELTLLVKFRVLVINILFESGFGLSCSFTRQKSSKYFFLLEFAPKKWVYTYTQI